MRKLPRVRWLQSLRRLATDESGDAVLLGVCPTPAVAFHTVDLGAQAGVTPLFDASHVGQWYCVETHARLNDPGQTNGVFEYWINGALQARETGLGWLGAFAEYGINAVFFENYWNLGSPAAQERYLDNIVVSTRRIGCLAL